MNTIGQPQQLQDLKRDVDKLQIQVYNIRRKNIAVFAKMYAENLVDPRKSSEGLKKLKQLRQELIQLSNRIDEYMGILVTIKNPKYYGKHREYYHQQFSGIKGSLNDKLARLRKSINHLMNDINKYNFGNSDWLNKEEELNAFEMLDSFDAHKFDKHAFEESIDAFNIAIALIVLILKRIKR